MVTRLIGAGIIIAALLAPATIASAQSDVPDLKGRWTGTTEVVLRSKVSEHINPTGQTTFTTIPFTIMIERQDGYRFAGTWASARATDPLIGMFRSDGKRLHMVDNDGTLTGELLEPDEMEVCRTEVAPDSMTVLCGIFTREREVRP